MPAIFADEPEHIGLLRETLQRFVAERNEARVGA